MTWKILTVYLVIINLIAFLAMAIDKYKAIRKLWRIPERTLIGLALLGGGIGANLGMHLFRHKTRHPKFFIGLPIIFLIEYIPLLYLWLIR